jgi:hypothetical protein
LIPVPIHCSDKFFNPIKTLDFISYIFLHHTLYFILYRNLLEEPTEIYLCARASLILSLLPKMYWIPIICPKSTTIQFYSILMIIDLYYHFLKSCLCMDDWWSCKKSMLNSYNLNLNHSQISSSYMELKINLYF